VLLSFVSDFASRIEFRSVVVRATGFLPAVRPSPVSARAPLAPVPSPCARPLPWSLSLISILPCSNLSLSHLSLSPRGALGFGDGDRRSWPRGELPSPSLSLSSPPPLLLPPHGLPARAPGGLRAPPRRFPRVAPGAPLAWPPARALPSGGPWQPLARVPARPSGSPGLAPLRALACPCGSPCASVPGGPVPRQPLRVPRRAQRVPVRAAPAHAVIDSWF
jgi:hypothetical protein